jgi:SAM-dependent methyltransferase
MVDSADAPLERSCPLGCGPLFSDGTILRDNRFDLPHTISIGWCRVCGLGVTLNAPTRSELSQLYQEAYAEPEVAGQVPRTGKVAHLWHRVNGSLPLTDRDLQPPVLDVGANTGETLLALRARGIEAVGLEPNPKAVAIARAAGLDVIEAPVEDALLAHGHFKSILLSQVLEHVDDPAKVLEIVRSALHPSGVVHIVVPNTRSVWRRVFGQDWVHWHVPFHLYHHTERSLAHLCAQHGLRVRRVHNVTPGEWLLMSLEARRNARAGRYRLQSFSGRYGRRALLAPFGRFFDAVHRGDAIVVEARHSV